MKPTRRRGAPAPRARPGSRPRARRWRAAARAAGSSGWPTTSPHSGVMISAPPAVRAVTTGSPAAIASSSDRLIAS